MARENRFWEGNFKDYEDGIKRSGDGDILAE
jgi:hypothetical protein